MGRRPLGLRAMTGAQRQRRYWQRLRARLEYAVATTGKPRSARALTWTSGTVEATGRAPDGAEYYIGWNSGAGRFEITFYPDDSGPVFLPDPEYPTMEFAKLAADHHNAKRLGLTTPA
jgi:hypothetical protein